MDLMVEFDKVLRKAPLGTTHWNTQRDKFVRMGESVVDGYLNLDIMRSVRSRVYAFNGENYSQLMGVVSAVPGGAEAYSLKSKKFIKKVNGFFMIVTEGGLIPVTAQTDIVDLVYLNHIDGLLFSRRKITK